MKPKVDILKRPLARLTKKEREITDTRNGREHIITDPADIKIILRLYYKQLCT